MITFKNEENRTSSTKDDKMFGKVKNPRKVNSRQVRNLNKSKGTKYLAR